MKAVFFSVFAFLILMVGCAPPVQYPTIPSTEYQPPTPPLTVTHKYELLLVDINNMPVQGATIAYTIKDHGDLVQDNTIISPSDGKVGISVQAKQEPSFLYVRNYKTELDYKVTKKGYYSKSGNMSSNYEEKDSHSKPVEKEKITLIQPIDYLNKDFASTLSNVKLKMKILSFIDLIILQGLVTESVLEIHSVNLVLFKGNKYLQFKFNNINVYNALRFNKYDIGKHLFDEVVRKLLTPLNENISESDLFHGYDLIVVGYTKNFTEKYAIAKPIEYRFIIPEKFVRQYKNKDISGQKVLDASIILMDDERIELQLQ